MADVATSATAVCSTSGSEWLRCEIRLDGRIEAAHRTAPEQSGRRDRPAVAVAQPAALGRHLHYRPARQVVGRNLRWMCKAGGSGLSGHNLADENSLGQDRFSAP